MPWAIQGKLSAYLDFIRWAAAVVVVVSHIKGLFFADYSDLASPRPALAALYAFASAGHQAVVVFFVMSGLFISATVMKALQQDRWSWGSYLTGRLTRLYIVLIPALLLGCLWDRGGIAAFGDTGVYDGLPEDRYVLGYSSAERSNPAAFAGNLLFLQGIATGHFGSNGPLWSLAYEFWYYILFPCVMLAITSKSGVRKLSYSAASLALCCWIGPKIALYFLIWSLGFALHLLPVRRLPRAGAWTGLSALLALASIFLYRLLPLNEFAADVVVALCFSALVYFMKSAYNGAQAAPWTTMWSRRLAGFSYTTYLAHFPLLVFLHAAFYQANPAKWQPGWRTFGYGAALLAGTLAYCWLVSLLTERRTDAVRRWLGSRMARRKERPAAGGTKRILET
jgi:peptidoglycan/LPS O-acetylase OafA/YrhL